MSKTPLTESEQLLHFAGETALANIQRARASALVAVGPEDLAIALTATVLLLERDFEVCDCDSCHTRRIAAAFEILGHLEVHGVSDPSHEGIRVLRVDGKGMH